jgi:hypothetical protein
MAISVSHCACAERHRVALATRSRPGAATSSVFLANIRREDQRFVAMLVMAGRGGAIARP